MWYVAYVPSLYQRRGPAVVFGHLRIFVGLVVNFGFTAFAFSRYADANVTIGSTK